MNVNKWGPHTWNFLHTMTFNYPLSPNDYDKQRYADFFNSLCKMLPCKYCRDSYCIYLKYIPVENFLDDRQGITYWLYIIHKLVNIKLKKKNIPFREVVEFYEDCRSQCDETRNRKPDFIKQYSIQCIRKYESQMNQLINKLFESNELFNGKNVIYISYLS